MRASPAHPGARRGGPPKIAPWASALAVVVAACGGGGEATAGTMDRETFIAVWVDLRSEALAHGEGGLPEADRTRILAEHGVTEDDLLTFAEVHGGDVPFMKAIWDEVEARMGEGNAPPGETGPDPEPGSAG